jgi:hypothetical protein
MHTADILTNALEIGKEIVFTFYWIDSDKWEGRNFNVSVEKKRQHHLVLEAYYN